LRFASAELLASNFHVLRIFVSELNHFGAQSDIMSAESCGVALAIRRQRSSAGC
jgi:hypothetical protein